MKCKKFWWSCAAQTQKIAYPTMATTGVLAKEGNINEAS